MMGTVTYIAHFLEERRKRRMENSSRINIYEEELRRDLREVKEQIREINNYCGERQA